VPQELRNIRENLGLAMDTLRGHKFRSLLTILGVFIGTIVIIVVASVIAGLYNQFDSMMKDFGGQSIYIYKWSPGFHGRLTREERMRKPLSYESAQAIEQQCPAVQRLAIWIFPNFGPVNAKYKGGEMDGVDFHGVTPTDFQVTGADLANGRFFTEVENEHRRNVAVVGADVVTMLFQNADPIGKEIQVAGNTFEIVGSLQKRKSFLGDNGADQAIVIPYWTFRKIYPAAKEQLFVAQAYQGEISQAEDEITGVLRRTRHDKPHDPDSFGMATADSIIRQFHQITGMVALVMIVLSSIGLLVGGIGVMNIMLVSVTERTREIGVRKAIGACRSDIKWQFLLEAMTLTGMGGVLGILVGYLISFLIRTLFPSFPSTVPMWAVIVGFVVPVFIGLFFGMWPALKASRLDPIVALRYE
jgi:putative ABC transport system permease protein